MASTTGNASGVATTDHDLRKRNAAGNVVNGHVPEKHEVDNKKLQKVRTIARWVTIQELTIAASSLHLDNVG